MVKVSVEQAVQAIRKEFRDLTNDEFQLGVARAINHTLAKVRTASSKEIRQVYNISAKDIRQAISITKASRSNMTGFVIAKGKPIPLKAFKPRQTKQGVSVVIKKGKRDLIRSAFLATMKSGHQGVFARGEYGSGSFAFRRKRLKKAGGYSLKGGKYQPNNNDLNITEITTISVPLSFANGAVLNNLARKIEDEFPSRMVHELMRIRT
jgi:hypothetical protein